MTYLLVKAVLSGIIIVAASEVARRSPGLGGLIASLPLVSILAIIWLWRDTADTERIAAQLEATFWFVLPSLPMFLVLPRRCSGTASDFLARPRAFVPPDDGPLLFYGWGLPGLASSFSPLGRGPALGSGSVNATR